MSVTINNSSKEGPMSGTAVMEMGFEVSDVSGQKMVRVSNLVNDATVSELVRGVLPGM